MRLENSKDKKSPLDDFKGLFVHKKSTESVPLFQVEYGLSLILTLLYCFEWFQNNIKRLCPWTLVLELCCFEWFKLCLQILIDEKSSRKIVSESFSLVSN